jgi:hypothetical protein
VLQAALDVPQLGEELDRLLPVNTCGRVEKRNREQFEHDASGGHGPASGPPEVGAYPPQIVTVVADPGTR